MKRIIQKSSHDCAICSVAMATGVPYSTVKQAAKKRAGYSSQRKNGTKSDRIKNVIVEIGLEAYPTGNGSFFNMATALKGRKGILIWRNTDTSNNVGHAVAWDGFKVVCPGPNSDPKESIESYNDYLRRTNKEWCGFIGVPTPINRRVASLTYCFFRSIYTEIKTEVKNVFKRTFNLLYKACVYSSKYISIFTRSMVCRFRLNKSTTTP